MKLSFNTVTLVRCRSMIHSNKRPPPSTPHPSPSPGRQRARDALMKVSLTGRESLQFQVLTAGGRKRNNSRADCSPSISSSFLNVLFQFVVVSRILITLHLQSFILFNFNFLLFIFLFIFFIRSSSSSWRSSRSASTSPTRSPSR